MKYGGIESEKGVSPALFLLPKFERRGFLGSRTAHSRAFPFLSSFIEFGDSDFFL